MNVIEKQFGKSALYVAPERYPVYIAEIITTRLRIDPDAVAPRLQRFFDECNELLRVFKFDQMPGLAGPLEMDLRQVELTLSRADEGRARQQRSEVQTRCARENWVQVEIDELLKVVSDPSQIKSIDWRGAQTIDGETLTREHLRERTRAAAYSDAGWRKFLNSLPEIKAPESNKEYV